MEQYLRDANRAKSLYAAGRIQEAQQLVKVIVKYLGNEASYERCMMLNLLGRCHLRQGRPDLAVKTYNIALNECQLLKDDSARLTVRAVLALDIGDAQTAMGNVVDGQIAYQQALDLAQMLKDQKTTVIAKTKLNYGAQPEGDETDTLRSWLAAVAHYRSIKDEEQLAAALQRLGAEYQKKGDWSKAEKAYRESAQLLEFLGKGAGYAWNLLAILYLELKQPQNAIPFMRKAVAAHRREGNRYETGTKLYNLASLLQNSMKTLDEAMRIAQEALSELNQAGANISDVSQTYDLLIEIADKQGNHEIARIYRSQVLKLKTTFFADLHEVIPYRCLVANVLAFIHGNEAERATAQNSIREQQVVMCQSGEAWKKFSHSLNSFLKGTRDLHELQIKQQGFVQGLLLKTLVSGAKDPDPVLNGLYKKQFSIVTQSANNSMHAKKDEQLIEYFLATKGSPEAFEMLLSRLSEEFFATKDSPALLLANHRRKRFT